MELAITRLAQLLMGETRLRKAEEHFLVGAGVLAGTLKHLPQPDRDQLTVDEISTEAVSTSEIEGEMLDRASVQSSIRRQLGLAADKRRIAPAEEGIADVMVDLHRSFAEPLAANKSNEVTAWLTWFAGITIEAQRRTAAHVEFLLEKTRLLDRLRGQLNSWQEKALLRMLREGPDGFRGGLSAGNYATITSASPATTTRDLADLVEKGALLRKGERRYARYQLAIPLKRVSPLLLDEHGSFE